MRNLKISKKFYFPLLNQPNVQAYNLINISHKFKTYYSNTFLSRPYSIMWNLKTILASKSYQSHNATQLNSKSIPLSFQVDHPNLQPLKCYTYDGWEEVVKQNDMYNWQEKEFSITLLVNIFEKLSALLILLESLSKSLWVL